MGGGGASSGEGQRGDFPASGHHSANGFSGAQWATVSWASATAQHDSRGGVKVTAEECLSRTRSLSRSLCHGFQRLSCEECSGWDDGDLECYPL